MAEQPKKKENPYEKCFCFSQGRCGPFKKWNKDGLTLIDNLDANISGHIKSLIRTYNNFSTYCFSIILDD